RAHVSRQVADALLSRQAHTAGVDGPGQLPRFPERRRAMTARIIRRGLVLVLVVASLHTLRAQVTFDRILKAKQEPQNWLTYSGGLYGQRHSELTQITPENVKNMEL